MSQPTLEPKLVTKVPGPASLALGKRLAAVESRNVTCALPEPIFWERARGANVWDVDGNRFVDLTAAFGVANVGHAHPKVVAAIASQAERLLHGMGDVHPPAVKVDLLEALVGRYPGGAQARGVLSSSGSDAVETDTFGANPLVLAEFDLADKTEAINIEAARIARAACEKFATPDRPRLSPSNRRQRSAGHRRPRTSMASP